MLCNLYEPGEVKATIAVSSTTSRSLILTYKHTLTHTYPHTHIHTSLPPACTKHEVSGVNAEARDLRFHSSYAHATFAATGLASTACSPSARITCLSCR